MRKDATKIRSSISPGALINTINVVTVLGFLWLIQRRGLASCNISILWNRYSVDWCVCLTSILYFTCLTSICDCFIPVPLITPCSNHYVWSAWNFDLVMFLLTVWINVMTGMSDRSAITTIFMPITGFWGWDWSDDKKPPLCWLKRITSKKKTTSSL